MLRFVGIGKGFQMNLKQGKDWFDGVNPEFRSIWANAFLMDDTLEQCLRPVALAASPELQSEVAMFDFDLPPEVRAALRSLMKASQ